MEKTLYHNEKIDHDQNFKRLIRLFFREFVELFLPDHYSAIDFTRVEFLDKETFTDLPKGRKRNMDMVVKVYLTGQGEQFILIHNEFESQRPRNLDAFRERMFLYFSQLYIRHRKPIIPIAIFSDDHKWHTVPEPIFDIGVCNDIYNHFRFRLIKLKNLNWKDFVRSENPLAFALMSKMNYNKSERVRLKAEFFRMITGTRVNTAKKYVLFEFIETYCQLTPEEQASFDKIATEDKQYKDINKMITIYEQRGIEKGIEKGIETGKIKTIIQIIEHRFQKIPANLKKMIMNIQDVKLLDNTINTALDANNIKEITNFLKGQTSKLSN